MSVLALAAQTLPDATALAHSSATGLAVALYMVLLTAGLLTAIGLVLHFHGRQVDWDEHKRRLAARPWHPEDALGMFALFLALQVGSVLGLLLMRHITHVAPTDSTQLVLQTLLLDWVGLTLVVVLLARRRESWQAAFGASWRSLGRAALLGGLFLLAALPFFFFYHLLSDLGLRWFGIDSSLQQAALVITDNQPLALRSYLMGMAVVVAPLFEEIIFRGILLPVCAKRIGTGLAIFLVSLLFAICHRHLPSTVPLFILSVALSLAYLYTGNLLVPVCMHGLFNAFNLALLTALR